MVEAVGNKPFMFSSDFPHEVNNDSCREEIEELIENPDLDDAAKAGILHTNAERFYGLQPVAAGTAGKVGAAS